MLTSILVWALVGLIAGWLAGQFTRGAGYGVVGDIIVGLIGAMIGGFLTQSLLGVDYTTGLNFTTIITSFIGAVLFVMLLRAFSGARAP